MEDGIERFEMFFSVSVSFLIRFTFVSIIFHSFSFKIQSVSFSICPFIYLFYFIFDQMFLCSIFHLFSFVYISFSTRFLFFAKNLICSIFHIFSYTLVSFSIRSNAVTFHFSYVSTLFFVNI